MGGPVRCSLWVRRLGNRFLEIHGSTVLHKMNDTKTNQATPAILTPVGRGIVAPQRPKWL
jgi:hypothetical protein